jgi:signal transduction histidine kinase
LRRKNDFLFDYLWLSLLTQTCQLLTQISQPFFTTKPTGEGTGLGLSLSYDIITKGHDGSLLVESQEGQGAELVIQLPSAKVGYEQG